MTALKDICEASPLHKSVTISDGRENNQADCEGYARSWSDRKTPMIEAIEHDLVEQNSSVP